MPDGEPWHGNALRRSLLGEQGINIGTFNLGRRQAGGEAVLLLSVDQPITPEVVQQACDVQGVRVVKALTFGA